MGLAYIGEYSGDIGHTKTMLCLGTRSLCLQAGAGGSVLLRSAHILCCQLGWRGQRSTPPMVIYGNCLGIEDVQDGLRRHRPMHPYALRRRVKEASEFNVIRKDCIGSGSVK